MSGLDGAGVSCLSLPLSFNLDYTASSSNQHTEHLYS